MRTRATLIAAGALAITAGLIAQPALAAKAKKTVKKPAATTTAAPATTKAVAPASTAAPVAVAGGTGSAECSKTGGVFRDGWNFATSDAAHYDPGLNTELVGAQVNNMMYDGLTRIDALTGKLVADVAESYSSNASADVWNFKIRKGV